MNIQACASVLAFITESLVSASLKKLERASWPRYFQQLVQGTSGVAGGGGGTCPGIMPAAPGVPAAAPIGLVIAPVAPAVPAVPAPTPATALGKPTALPAKPALGVLAGPEVVPAVPEFPRIVLGLVAGLLQLAHSSPTPIIPSSPADQPRRTRRVYQVMRYLRLHQ
jgi:hypothetical protein